MFGLMLPCAFAASTPTVVAKMPTLAIAIRARFMIYLPFEITSAEGNACVKANVPNDYRVIAAIAARGSFSAGSSDENPARVWQSKGRDRSGGVSGPHHWGLRFGNTLLAPEVPHGIPKNPKLLCPTPPWVSPTQELGWKASASRGRL